MPVFTDIIPRRVKRAFGLPIRPFLIICGLVLIVLQGGSAGLSAQITGSEIEEASRLTQGDRDELSQMLIELPHWQDRFFPDPFKKYKPGEVRPRRFLYVDSSGLIAAGSEDADQASPLQLNEGDANARYNNYGIARYRDNRQNAAEFEKNLAEIYSYFVQGARAEPRFLPFNYNAGIIALRLKKYEEARIYLERAVALLPEFWGSHIYLGRVWLKLGFKQRAVNSWRRALKHNPLNQDASVALGDYYLNEKMYTRSASYYNYTLRSFHDHVGALSGLGRIALTRGNSFEAVYIFDRINFDLLIEKKTPYSREVHYHFARALVDERDFARAVKQYDILLNHPEDAFFIEIPYDTVQKQRLVADRLARIKALSQ